ncbi:hypothetical protein PCE1_002655 [Barthelona sp. PCE]
MPELPTDDLIDRELTNPGVLPAPVRLEFIEPAVKNLDIDLCVRLSDKTAITTNEYPLADRLIHAYHRRQEILHQRRAAGINKMKRIEDIEDERMREYHNLSLALRNKMMRAMNNRNRYMMQRTAFARRQLNRVIDAETSRIQQSMKRKSNHINKMNREYSASIRRHHFRQIYSLRWSEMCIRAKRAANNVITRLNEIHHKTNLKQSRALLNHIDYIESVRAKGLRTINRCQYVRSQNELRCLAKREALTKSLAQADNRRAAALEAVKLKGHFVVTRVISVRTERRNRIFQLMEKSQLNQTTALLRRNKQRSKRISFAQMQLQRGKDVARRIEQRRERLIENYFSKLHKASFNRQCQEEKSLRFARMVLQRNDIWKYKAKKQQQTAMLDWWDLMHAADNRRDAAITVVIIKARECSHRVAIARNKRKMSIEKLKQTIIKKQSEAHKRRMGIRNKMLRRIESHLCRVQARHNFALTKKYRKRNALLKKLTIAKAVRTKHLDEIVHKARSSYRIPDNTEITALERNKARKAIEAGLIHANNRRQEILNLRILKARKMQRHSSFTF